jgi:hypothetical protein
MSFGGKILKGEEKTAERKGRNGKEKMKKEERKRKNEGVEEERKSKNET